MDTTAPRFELPTASDALIAVLETDIPTDLQADRINLQVLESGEVAYRFHPADGSDYVGGVTFAHSRKPVTGS